MVSTIVPIAVVLSIQAILLVDASCYLKDPKFKTLLKGPDVTQNPCQYSSGCHDVQVTVCWMQIIKNPDCVDEYNIYYWKKLTESEARATKVHVGTKKSGKIDKHTHQAEVKGLQPDIEYVFIVEIIEKTTKKKSAPTTFHTQRSIGSSGSQHGGRGGSFGDQGGSGGSFGHGSNAHHGSGGSGGSFGGGGSSSRRPSYSTCTQRNALLSTDGLPIKVEYAYSTITRKYDMQRVVIKFDASRYVKYPGCIKELHVLGRMDSSIENQYKVSSNHNRIRRSIGQLPNQKRGSVNSQSYSSSSSSSSFSRSSSSSGGSFGGSSTSGRVHISYQTNVQKYFYHPGDTTALRNNGHSSAAWKQTGSILEVVMDKIKPCSTYRFEIKIKTVTKSGNRETEKDIGTVRDVILPPMAFVSNFKLPLLSKVLKFEQFGNTIKIGYQTLGNSIPSVCLMKYVAAVDAKLSVAQTSLHGIGGRSGSLHGSMGSSSSSRPNREDDAIKQILKQKGCECHNTIYLNLTSTSAKIVKKHKSEMGMYKAEGKIHENRPYWKLVNGPARYIYWYISDRRNTQTWYISDRLGSTSPILKMENNVDSSCPADLKKTGMLSPHGKYWQAKGILGTWSKDKNMKLTCHQHNKGFNNGLKQEGESCGSCFCPPTYTAGNCAPGLQCQKDPRISDAAGKCVRAGNGYNPNIRPIHPGQTANEQGVKDYLRSKGCKCHDTPYLNITSSDSRTKSNNKDQLGLYKMESTSSLHSGRPYWAKRAQSPKKTYFVYWEQSKKTWYISDTLGSRTGIVYMENNANGICPSNTVTGKYWQRKNSFNVMARDKTMKVECKGPGKVGWTSNNGRSVIGSSGGHYGHGQQIQSDHTVKLAAAGCKCKNKDKIKFSSTDSRTKSKHSLQLGVYSFEGQLHSGKPYYVKRATTGQPKTYFMYWNNSEKTWWIGESLTNNKALMKMQSNSTLKCPADPLGVGESKKKWQRKNSVGWWGDDSTATVRCGV